MENPNLISKRTEAFAMARLVQLGISVSIPWGSNRYDFIVDWDTNLYRAQCKTAPLRRGAVTVDATSYTSSGGRKTYGSHEIDVVLGWCADLDTLYWVPHSHFGKSGVLTLRVDPPKNGQRKKILWAKEFDIKGLFGTASVRGPGFESL
jgi:hypothetical protein